VLLGYRNYRLGSYRTVIDPGAALERDDFFFESSFRSIFCLSMIFSENRSPLFRIMHQRRLWNSAQPITLQCCLSRQSNRKQLMVADCGGP